MAKLIPATGKWKINLRGSNGDANCEKAICGLYGWSNIAKGRCYDATDKGTGEPAAEIKKTLSGAVAFDLSKMIDGVALTKKYPKLQFLIFYAGEDGKCSHIIQTDWIEIDKKLRILYPEHCIGTDIVAKANAKNREGRSVLCQIHVPFKLLFEELYPKAIACACSSLDQIVPTK